MSSSTFPIFLPSAVLTFQPRMSWSPSATWKPLSSSSLMSRSSVLVTFECFFIARFSVLGRRWRCRGGVGDDAARRTGGRLPARAVRPQPPPDDRGHHQEHDDQQPWCATLLFLDPDFRHDFLLTVDDRECHYSCNERSRCGADP